MKITGIAVALIGVAIALYCGVTFMNYKTPSESDAVSATEPRRGPDLSIPLLLSVSAIVAGGAIILFGGRGYETVNTPGASPST